MSNGSRREHGQGQADWMLYAPVDVSLVRRRRQCFGEDQANSGSLKYVSLSSYFSHHHSHANKNFSPPSVNAYTLTDPPIAQKSQYQHQLTYIHPRQ